MHDLSDPNQRPIVQIDGAQVVAGTSGLVLSGFSADESEVFGLAIYRFPSHGILLSSVDDVVVQGCHVGVRKGSAANGNGGNGIDISVFRC